jgi:hypothetical protein
MNDTDQPVAPRSPSSARLPFHPQTIAELVVGEKERVVGFGRQSRHQA